jgi:hypothetical protein
LPSAFQAFIYLKCKDVFLVPFAESHQSPIGHFLLALFLFHQCFVPILLANFGPLLVHAKFFSYLSGTTRTQSHEFSVVDNSKVSGEYEAANEF